MDPAEYVKALVGALATGQALIEPAQVKYTVSPGVGILRPAVQCPSPNQDDRPAGTEPELIIIHSISLPPCEFGGPHVEQLFTNCLDWGEHPYFREIEGLQVSAHLFVRRDGAIVQFAPFGRRAWHAGTSCFRGRPNCNDYSIGVELEGDDDTPYDDAQYDVLVGILAALMETYKGLTTRRIAGHCDVAPGRKTDPGPAFDWLRLYDGLARRGEDGGEK
ncbi:MAG: 1,6-anhydro-N-acetylmuramyl-L-alanine amidase AmpD [Gammaproteobacteria bacterium]|nr:1,6-anhydro-N-acetylmuramyl-L-alanine amidase AmpD [Gammaproteobacteria bacterium]